LYEGFGISIVEAMRAQTPVIAHKGSCYPEVIGDAGILVDGNNAKKVGRTMYEVYTDDMLRDKLIKKGKERAEGYSWDRAVDELKNVLKKI